MAKNIKFWFGLAIGVLGGMLISQRINQQRRMPNTQAWQQILSKDMDHIEAAAFIARVQQRYDELTAQKITLENKALQSHLQENIIPGLALYQTWRAEGLDQAAALEKVDAVYAAQYQEGSTKLTRQSSVLKFVPGGFSTFKRLVQLVMQQGFPAPGFEVEYIPDLRVP